MISSDRSAGKNLSSASPAGRQCRYVYFCELAEKGTCRQQHLSFQYLVGNRFASARDAVRICNSLLEAGWVERADMEQSKEEDFGSYPQNIFR